MKRQAQRNAEQRRRHKALQDNASHKFWAWDRVRPTWSHHTVDWNTFINPDNKELFFFQGTSISIEYEQSFFQWANSSNNKLAET